jgi:hypothetical protein
MKKTLLLLSLLLLSAGPIFAQDAKWVRVETFMETLSFKIPEGYFAYRNKERSETYLSWYENKVAINVSMIKVLQARSRLARIEDGYDQFDCKYDYFTLGPIAAKIFTCESDKQFSKTIYLATDDRYCKFVVAAPTADSVNVSLFLMSLRSHRAPIFPKYGDKPDANDKVLREEEIKSSPLVEKYLKMPDAGYIKVTAPKDIKDTGEKVLDADSPVYSRPTIMLRKYAPSFPKVDKTGPPIHIRVKLRVQFLAGGQIGKVEVLVTNGFEYTEAAIDSLRKLKFVPAQIDGKDVDTSRVLDFSFDTF